MSTAAVREDLYPSRNGRAAGVLPRLDPVVHSDPTEAGDAALTAALKHFDEKGYVIFDRLFRPEEVEVLNRELRAILASEEWRKRVETITEPASQEVRSVFKIHQLNAAFDALSRDPRIVRVAEKIVGSQTYIHQSRLNFKPGFDGKEFYWHSDFETWHVEDGMPRMRAVSCSIALSDNHAFNGSLMVIPGSHRHYVTCAGTTPAKHYEKSLKKQEYGVPDRKTLGWLVDQYGIDTFLGKAGSVIFFDCNTMHGSNGNITPLPRSNAFFVYNSVHNALTEPFAGIEPRPLHIASREFTPIEPTPWSF